MSFEVVFFLLFFGGWAAGRLAQLVTLPPILGMTLWGIGLGVLVEYLGYPWPGGFWDLVPFLKSLALVVILLRAGLGLSRKELKRAGMAGVLMAFVPAVFEGAALMVSLRWILEFSWPAAGLTAFMLAAVSPAVVVPSMLELQEKGIGKKNGVITIILAGASADDVFAITIFTVFLGLAQGFDVSMAGALATIPLTLAGGIGLGGLVGWIIARSFRRHHHRIRATEKTLLVLASSVFLVQVGTWTGLAALLGVMTLGLMVVEFANPAALEMASKLGKVWVFAQIFLFVAIGLALEPAQALVLGPKALGILALGLVARSVGVLLATWPSSLTWGERWFSVLAYLPKATVQAALGGIALSVGIPEGKAILSLAVVAILMTAPLGLFGIRWGKRWLEGS
ncbi:MAG: peptidase [Spirochaetales bacterium]|nr:peptidase [Spirochaetales bacterium]